MEHVLYEFSTLGRRQNIYSGYSPDGYASEEGKGLPKDPLQIKIKGMGAIRTHFGNRHGLFFKKIVEREKATTRVRPFETIFKQNRCVYHKTGPLPDKN